MKKDIFNVELNRFNNQNVRTSTEIILDMMPDYFYEIPAVCQLQGSAFKIGRSFFAAGINRKIAVYNEGK